MHFATFAFQNVPPAPGRGADQGGGTVQQPPPSGGPGGGPPPEGGGGLFGLLPMLLFIPLLFFLFWSSRSQAKKQEAAIASLKKGDRVVTQGGFVGRLLEVDQRYAKVELAPGTKVTILRSSLVGRDTDEASGKKAEPADRKSEPGDKGDKADKK